MKCYIKDKKTFATKAVYDVSKYNVFLHTIFDDKSIIRVAGKHDPFEDDFIYFNNWTGIIKSSQIKNGYTEYACIDIINIFDISSDFYNDYFSDSIENNIGNMIDLFLTNSDEMYDLNFIDFGYTTHTVPVATMYPDLNDGIFSWKDYVEKARRLHDIHLNYSIGRVSGADTLKIIAAKKPTVTRKIDMSDSSYKVTGENYSSETCSTITTAVYDSDTASVTLHTYYLKTDGTVTDIKPDLTDRAVGKRKLIFAESGKELQKSTEEFLKNKYSHRIEFASIRELDFFDMLQIRINEKILNSYISSVRITDETNKYIYTSGEMRTKLTDKLKELNV